LAVKVAPAAFNRSIKRPPLAVNGRQDVGCVSPRLAGVRRHLLGLVSSALLSLLLVACGSSGYAASQTPNASSTVAGGSRIDTASIVKVVFARHGFRLRYPGLWNLRGLPRRPHALPMSYVVNGTAAITKHGAVALTPAGPYFEVVVYPTATTAKEAFTSRWIALFHRARQPWARSSNVDLVALLPIAPNHLSAVWRRARDALDTLR